MWVILLFIEHHGISRSREGKRLRRCSSQQARLIGHSLDVTTCAGPCLFHSGIVFPAGTVTHVSELYTSNARSSKRRPNVLRHGASGRCSLCTSGPAAAQGNMACNADETDVNRRVQRTCFPCRTIVQPGLSFALCSDRNSVMVPQGTGRVEEAEMQLQHTIPMEHKIQLSPSDCKTDPNPGQSHVRPGPPATS